MLVFKKEKRICKKCGKIFTAKKKKHFYCVRKCYMSEYREKHKNDDKEIEEKLPSFICPKCNKIQKLTFNPLEKQYLWSKFICIYCGYTNKDNDYKVIKDIKKNWKKL